ncbi:MAG: DUF1491 family protein [Sphingomonadaceae bacterium]|nr:DUF1491 family protein [Sphingomonadaceae bacterium]NBU78917.1 DUF1491 family protein [Sphingomonadaceae bacterium]NCA00879.1 DUF1491 family protein [Sphingomonadaceae bacterium]
MTPRLATSLYVNALVRCVNQAGGMAMVLAKGDETAGALVLITLENGVNTGVWERSWTADGAYRWAQIHTQVIENEQEISTYCARRRASDPDLWIVELDIADAAQFAVELDGKR